MGLTLHPMKEIRVIVAGEQRAFVTDLLEVQATGYTVIGNVSGKGHHGQRMPRKGLPADQHQPPEQTRGHGREAAREQRVDHEVVFE